MFRKRTLMYVSFTVSSTLVEIPKYGKILLDSGEGTWGQLVRLFGDDPACTTGVWEALRTLKCIFISHIHGDHHIGLAKLLAMRRKVRASYTSDRSTQRKVTTPLQLTPPPTEPIYVVGVRSVLLYLREMSELEDLGLEQADGAGVVTILADALNWKDPRSYGERYSEEPWMDAER